jgi:hypothetical protein
LQGWPAAAKVKRKQLLKCRKIVGLFDERRPQGGTKYVFVHHAQRFHRVQRVNGLGQRNAYAGRSKTPYKLNDPVFHTNLAIVSRTDAASATQSRITNFTPSH